MTQRFRKRPLFWIFLFALGLRVLVVTLGIGFDRDLSFFDARDYDRHARNFLAGEGLTNGVAVASRPPLYPLFLAGCYALTGGSLLFVRIVQALLGALSILLVYGVLRRFVSREASLWTAGLMAVHPLLIRYAGNLLPDTLGLLLLALFLWVFLRDRLRVWLGGALFGLLLLCRPPLFCFLPFVLFDLFREKRRWAPLFGFCVAMLLVLSPWTIRNARLLHAFVPLTTNGGTTFWDANNPEVLEDPAKTGIASEWLMPGKVTRTEGDTVVLLSETEGDRYLYRKGLRFLRDLLKEKPHLFGYLLLRKFLAAFSLHGGKETPELFGWALAYLVLLPLGLWRSRLLEKRPVLLYQVILQYLLCSLLFFGRAKYRVVIEPYLICFIVMGIQRVCRRFT